MVVEKVDAKTYSSVIAANLSHIFNSAEFCELNACKCDEIHYLLFREEKYRLGIVLGQRGSNFFSPFSAPFGGFEAVRKDVQMQFLENAVELLKAYVEERNGSKMKITLPPLFYAQSVISKTINVLYRKEFSVDVIDVNHTIDLRSWNIKAIKRQAGFEGMKFHLCEDSDEKSLVYDIISQNRAHRGYPLRMTKEQVMQTTSLVDADFFLVRIPCGQNVASALVYRVSKDIVQVIYWGNLSGFDEFRPMNFLALNLFEFYAKSGLKTVDIGPSSENSFPNYGLCDFKERIGCEVHPKFSFVWKK